MLQLTDRSILDPDGIFEDVMVSIDSWEYPTYFLVLQPKTKFNGYPLILGRPWLATADAYISFRVGNMTISCIVMLNLLLNMTYPYVWKWRRMMNYFTQLATQSSL